MTRLALLPDNGVPRADARTAGAVVQRKTPMIGTEARREYIQRVYIRVCGDSDFKMDYIRAAHFAAKLIDVSPVEIWLALTLHVMEAIAAGTHPCLLLPRYADQSTRARAAKKQAA